MYRRKVACQEISTYTREKIMKNQELGGEKQSEIEFCKNVAQKYRFFLLQQNYACAFLIELRFLMDKWSN